MSDLGKTGRRVFVGALGETPLQTLETHLRVEAQPPPDPATLGPKDVVVAVRAAAVGWVDLIMMSGQYQHVPEPPYTPGLEYAGEVRWVGAEVEDLAVGAAVVADGSLTGPRSLGDYRPWGGFASWAVAPREALVPLPKALSQGDGEVTGYDRAAGFLGAYETAYHALVVRGALAAGETVLIHGASGTTGLAAVHVAKHLGATVLATGRTPSKLEVVKAQGADHVIPSKGGFKDAVKKLTGGKGVDVVYDPVGGKVSLESLRCVRFGARFLIVGWASTPFVARKDVPPNQLPTNLVMMKSLDVRGCPAVISAHRDPSLRDARRGDILAWARDGAIVPHVERAFAMDDVADALRAKWESRFVGGAVLRPDPV